MAIWDEKYQGDEMVTCPICYVEMTKRKKTTHMSKCFKTNKDKLPEMGLIKCPLHNMHIFPRKYLNFHLDGHCEEAKNQLRRFFQDKKPAPETQIKPPTDFLDDDPDSELLDDNSKRLLYLLKRDIKGNDISSNTKLYPPKQDKQMGEEGETSSSGPS